MCWRAQLVTDRADCLCALWAAAVCYTGLAELVVAEGGGGYNLSVWGTLKKPKSEFCVKFHFIDWYLPVES